MLGLLAQQGLGLLFQQFQQIRVLAGYRHRQQVRRQVQFDLCTAKLHRATQQHLIDVAVCRARKWQAGMQWCLSPANQALVQADKHRQAELQRQRRVRHRLAPAHMQDALPQPGTRVQSLLQQGVVALVTWQRLAEGTAG